MPPGRSSCARCVEIVPAGQGETRPACVASANRRKPRGATTFPNGVFVSSRAARIAGVRRAGSYQFHAIDSGMAPQDRRTLREPMSCLGFSPKARRTNRGVVPVIIGKRSAVTRGGLAIWRASHQFSNARVALASRARVASKADKLAGALEASARATSRLDAPHRHRLIHISQPGSERARAGGQFFRID